MKTVIVYNMHLRIAIVVIILTLILIILFISRKREGYFDQPITIGRPQYPSYYPYYLTTASEQDIYDARKQECNLRCVDRFYDGKIDVDTYSACLRDCNNLV